MDHNLQVPLWGDPGVEEGSRHQGGGVGSQYLGTEIQCHMGGGKVKDGTLGGKGLDVTQNGTKVGWNLSLGSQG